MASPLVPTCVCSTWLISISIFQKYTCWVALDNINLLNELTTLRCRTAWYRKLLWRLLLSKSSNGLVSKYFETYIFRASFIPPFLPSILVNTNNFVHLQMMVLKLFIPVQVPIHVPLGITSIIKNCFICTKNRRFLVNSKIYHRKWYSYLPYDYMCSMEVTPTMFLLKGIWRQHRRKSNYRALLEDPTPDSKKLSRKK
jgi:hypothetical protein